MANNMSACLIMKWKELKESTGICPKPRHGHRCVASGKHIIILGGGNEGIIREINVYNTVTGKWLCPASTFTPPPGCAAFGIVCYEGFLYTFGGIYEQGTYSNDIYKISLANWSWSVCNPKCEIGVDPPLPRLGHSFTLSSKNEVYMFGGLTSDNSTDVPGGRPKYLNDLYKLTINRDGTLKWSMPPTFGSQPCPRESHTTVIYNLHGKETLIVYGGMCGRRLGDIHFLDLETMEWVQHKIQGPIPPARSLHVAGVCNNRMIVFGGWIPANDNIDKSVFTENDWKCTNNVSCLNLETLSWEWVQIADGENLSPRPRAGHCGVMLNNRFYIWSGRDGFRKSWNDQVCCKDLWYLETCKAPPPARIMMDGTDISSVSVKWDPIPNADFYILQVMKVGPNTVCNSNDVKGIFERNIQIYKRETANLLASQLNAQNMPALKFVAPVGSLTAQRNDESKPINGGEITKDVESNVSEENAPLSQNQNIDMSNLSLNARDSWIVDTTTNGDGISYDFIQSVGNAKADHKTNNTKETDVFIESVVENLDSPNSLCQFNEVPKTSNGEARSMLADKSSAQTMNISSDDLINRSTMFKPRGLEFSTPIRNIPPLGVSVLPTGQQSRVQSSCTNNMSVSPKKLSFFHDIPMGRWFESSIVSESKASINQFYIDISSERTTSRSNANRRSIPLESNYTYRLRIASVNSCGIGHFSLPLTFSTLAPNLPGPPCAVKIIKKGSTNISYLVWCPPVSSPINEVLEYSVYISKPITQETSLPINLSHFKYIYEQIYQGKDCKCLISPHLKDAFEVLDGGVPYLMLRIVPKNSTGYGPVTQVRWLINETHYFSYKKSAEKFEIPLKRFKAY